MRDDKYIHEQPCGCTRCEHTRRVMFSGPGLYKSIARHARMGGGNGTTTWTLERFVWGESIAVGELIYVVRDLVPGEPGGENNHIDGVLIIPLDGREDRFIRSPYLCTSKKWLEPA